jgi:hypothetical protein
MPGAPEEKGKEDVKDAMDPFPLGYPWLSGRRRSEGPSAAASALLEVMAGGIIGDGDGDGPSPCASMSGRAFDYLRMHYHENTLSARRRVSLKLIESNVRLTSEPALRP